MNFLGGKAVPGTLQAVIERLNNEAAAVVNMPGPRALHTGGMPVLQTPQEFEPGIEVEEAKGAKVVKSTGVPLDRFQTCGEPAKSRPATSYPSQYRLLMYRKPSPTGTERQSENFAVSSRKIIAESADVQVKEFTLSVDEQVPWHHHTDVFDVFYCIEGELTVERVDVPTSKRLDDLVLKIGDSGKVEPRTAHRPFNHGAGTCRFLLVQGIGKYDFLPYQPISDAT